MSNSQEYNPILGYELYREGYKRWPRITNSSRIPLSHDEDIEKAKEAIISQYYKPAAAFGCPDAMLACSMYFKNKNKILAIGYFKRYLKALTRR